MRRGAVPPAAVPALLLLSGSASGRPKSVYVEDAEFAPRELKKASAAASSA